MKAFAHGPWKTVWWPPGGRWPRLRNPDLDKSHMSAQYTVEEPVALVTLGRLLRKDFTDDDIIRILSWGADAFKRLLQAIIKQPRL